MKTTKHLLTILFVTLFILSCKKDKTSESSTDSNNIENVENSDNSDSVEDHSNTSTDNNNSQNATSNNTTSSDSNNTNDSQNEEVEEVDSSNPNPTSIKVNESKLKLVDVDRPPVHPGCEGLSSKETIDCMNEKIIELVSVRYDKYLSQNLGLKEDNYQLAVAFDVDKQGNVVNVRADGPVKPLEEEAIRVIKMIPQMQPGMHNGKPITVSYELPIKLDVNDK